MRRSIFLLMIALAGTAHARFPIHSAARDPFGSCAVEAGDGDETWRMYRAKHSLVSWPDASLPEGTPRTQVTKARSDDSVILLHNDVMAAMFDDRGALLGLWDRSYGADFIRPTPESTRSAWEFCTGGPTVDRDCRGASGIYRSESQPRPEMTTPVIDGDVGIRFVWSEVGDRVVTVEYSLQRNHTHTKTRGLKARIQVSGSGSSGMITTRFPRVMNLGRDVGDDATSRVRPNRLGLVEPGGGPWYGAEGGQLIGHTQTGHMSMNMAGWCGGDHCLYLGLEEPGSGIHFVRFPSRTAIDDPFFVEHYPASGMGEVARSDDGIDTERTITLDPICGGTGSHVARRYRRYAIRQRFGNGRKIIDRSEVPERVRNGMVWYAINAGNSASPKKYGHAIDVDIAQLTGGDASFEPMGFHLYNYYDPPFGAGMPIHDLIPGIASTVEARRGAKGNVMLAYINIGFIDGGDAPDAVRRGFRGSKHGKATGVPGPCDARVTGGNLHNDCCSAFPPWNYGRYRAPDGTGGVWGDHALWSTAAGHYHWFLQDTAGLGDPAPAPRGTEGDGMSGCAIAMNVASKVWRDRVNAWVRDVMTPPARGGLGADAAYLDTFPNPFADFRQGRNHPQPRGYGQWSIEANRSLTQEALAYSDWLVAEHPADAYHDLVVATVNYGSALPDQFPLQQIVYHDRHIFIGNPAYMDDDNTAFAIKHARAVVWGAHPDGINPQHVGGHRRLPDWDPRRPAYLRELLTALRELRAFLSYGDMLGVVETEDGTRVSSTRYKPCLACRVQGGGASPPNGRDLTFDALQGGVFMDPSGNKAIVVTNVSEDDLVGERIVIPPAWRGIHGIEICDPSAPPDSRCVPLGIAGESVPIDVESRRVRYLKFGALP